MVNKHKQIKLGKNVRSCSGEKKKRKKNVFIGNSNAIIKVCDLNFKVGDVRKMEIDRIFFWIFS
jgi:hypothetical protein